MSLFDSTERDWKMASPAEAVAEKQVMVVAIDDSEHSTYALAWTIDHFFTPYASNHPFKLVLDRKSVV